MAKGERIKKLRKENNLTLEELANKANTTRQTIHKYETGLVTNIPSDKIEILARALHTTPAYIMGWEDLEHDTKITEADITKIGTTPEKIKDDILNLKPFNNIVDAITFIKEYEVKFFAELDLSNKTINDVIDLVNNILENTQDTIRAERNR